MPIAAGSAPRLTRTLASALLWSASFLFAVTCFFSAAKLLRPIPAPPPAAVGYVTIEDVSKPRDYAQAALFYVLVPALTILLNKGLRRLHGRLTRGVTGASALASAALFSLPFLLSPFLFLTTRREQWGILFPPILGMAAAWGYAQVRRRARVRRLFTPRLAAWHGLILLEAAGWIVFRYIATGARIAHIPTLFLEIPFAAFFLAMFWMISLGIAQGWSAIGTTSIERNLAAFATGASPLLLLPLVALLPIDARLAATLIWASSIVGITVALIWEEAARRPPSRQDGAASAVIPRSEDLQGASATAHPEAGETPATTRQDGAASAVIPRSEDLQGASVTAHPVAGETPASTTGGLVSEAASRRARAAIVYLVVPLLLFVVSWSSSLHLTGWVDLFHRGESLGPASDYLRGDAPYTDIFVLHGLMEDGALDAWLMEIFGRSAEVSTTRLVVFGGLSVIALWLLAFALFDSIPLALFVIALGFVTFIENARALTETVVVAILFLALTRRSLFGIGAAGVAAAIALFYSLDMGLYSIAGSLATIVLVSLVARSGRRMVDVASKTAAFLLGFALGSAPFLVWLATRGALAEFFRTSFVDVPRLIDPVWSLPFPDLAKFFVGDLHLRNVAEFLLSDRWRFILNPLVLGIAAVVLLTRITPWGAASRRPPRRQDGAAWTGTGRSEDFAGTSLTTHPEAGGTPATTRQDGAASAGTSRSEDFALSSVTAHPEAGGTPATTREGLGRTDVALLILTVFGIITQRSALGRADFPHQHFSAFLIAPLLVLLLALLGRRASRLWSGGSAATRVLISTFGAVGGIALGSLLWIPDLLGNRLDAVTSYRARIHGQWRDPEAERVTLRMRAVVAAVERLSPPSAPMFDFSNQPAFYFFADRPNPTRFFQIPIISPPRFQAEVIRDLEATRPPLVLRRSPDLLDRFDGIPNRDRAQAVAAYLDDRYRHAMTVQGVEIWRRLADLPPVRSEVYLRHIHIPGSRTPGRPSRVVFPAVGSATGAAGSRWVSDLLIQNPHDEPLVLRLRYARPDRSIDRTLVAEPGRVLVVTDFPRELFDSPESVGALWIEHPSERAPILRVQTRDAAREGAVSTAEPLGPEDAAGAGTGHDEIRILGARGGAALRLNLGAVNLGEGTARIRIRVSAPDGAPLGGAMEHALAEEQSWTLVDAGERLGFEIEPGVLVHIDVLEGRVAGWASIIDGMSGRHEILKGVPRGL